MLLEVTKLKKTFGDVAAVLDASFRLDTGRVLSLLGPSGCGKTTTLRMIAGFEPPTAGHIVLGGRDMTSMPARKRNVGMVFQSYALFPHMTAAENIAFGLEMRNVGRAERDERVARALGMVRMAQLGDRSPKQLSGGQQQRIALARALVIEPDVLLLDEPLSALDLKLREEMRDEIHRIVRELNISTIFVTHDQGEALVLSDLVAVMNEGVIDQLDSPAEVYYRPQTAFVANFIGGANVLKGRQRSGQEYLFDADIGVTLRLPTVWTEPTGAIAVRPEDIEIASDSLDSHLQATVIRARFLGNIIEYTVATERGQRLTVRADGRGNFSEGQRIQIGIRADRVVPLRR